jgi:hypothetical protein
MMKKIERNHCNERGAALIIAMTAAVVVMLSVMLLLGYISGMVDQQSVLEDRTQARLTESSAVDGLAWLLDKNLIEDGNNLPRFTVGTMTTTFDVDGMENTPPYEFRILLDGYDDPLLLASGEGLFIVGIRDGVIIVDLFDPLTGRSVSGYPVEVCGETDSWIAAAGTVGGEPVAFVIARGGGVDQICCIQNGSLTVSETDVIVLSGNSLFSVGELDTEPALLVSNGSNWAQLIAPGTGTVYYGSSPSGTSPVFLPDGRVYGHFSPDPLFAFPGAGIVDNFLGDFNRDGTPDVAWAGPHSFTFFSGLTGELILDNVAGHVLVAWGSVEGRFKLGGCWMSSDGTRTWRRLSYNGFRDYSAGGVLDFEWFGRIEGLNNMLIGIVGDSIGIANLAQGELTPVCSALSGFMGDIDGSNIDIISIDDSDARLIMNPLDGNGFVIMTLADTQRRDRTIIRNGWDFYIYGAGDNRRVFIEGERTVNR